MGIKRGTSRKGSPWRQCGVENLGLKIKLCLYEATVMSILVYDCESWILDKEVMKILNGANGFMLTSFTGKTIRQEVTSFTTSLNLMIFKLL